MERVLVKKLRLPWGLNMYEKTYGFLENPFSLTPDPKFFFPSPKHTDALNSLIYTITEKRGFAVITGDIGCGKTTVCRTLLNRLDSGTKVAMITNPPSTPQQLLGSILEDLGVTFNAEPRPNLLSCLKKYLIEQSFLDFNVVLIIDEAQNLTPRILEEIRLLSNLETEKKKIIQIILVGHPELKDKLKLKELTQLRQRINVQYHILPLDRADTENYIRHRLRACSINGNSQVEFIPEALDEIYTYSQGIPRIINMLCNNALLIGYVTEAKQITPQIIKEAKEEFGDEEEDEKKAELDEQNQKLAAKELQLQSAESGLQQLNAQLNQLQKDKEEAQGSLHNCESLFRSKQVLCEELEQNLTQLKQDLQNLQGQKHKSQQEQETLLIRLKSTQDQLKECHLELTQKQSELTQTNQQLQSSQEVLTSIQSLLNRRKSELDEQNQKLAARQSQLQAAESQLQQLNEELNQLQKDKQKAQAEQANLNQEWLKRQSEWKQKEEEAFGQLGAAESRLQQLNEELKKVQEEYSQLKLQQETLFLKLKASQEELNSCTSTIAGRVTELDQINKSLESRQRDLNTTESKCQQKHSELEQITLQLDNADKELQSKGPEVKETKHKLSQLKNELYQTKQQKEKLQAESKELNRNLIQLKEELKNLQEHKAGCQKEQEKLNQAGPNLEKLSAGLVEKPVIKLKAKHPKAEPAVLTASTSNGEIKINPADKDDYLSSVYNAIRIFHLSKDMRNYKNFNFCAKANRKGGYPLFFNLELKNGPRKIGKHYKVEIADSWQKVIIPLGEFNRITRLDSVTEVNLLIDYDIEDTEGVTYFNDIRFSH